MKLVISLGDLMCSEAYSLMDGNWTLEKIKSPNLDPTDLLFLTLTVEAINSGSLPRGSKMLGPEVGTPVVAWCPLWNAWKQWARF